VTLRVVAGLVGLRNSALVREVRETFAKGCERGDFRLVEYSIQHNHLHLIVEAEPREAQSRGMISISARFARAVNQVFRRAGQVIAGRYQVQLLKSPTQVRNALRYVLLNILKHFKQRYGPAQPSSPNHPRPPQPPPKRNEATPRRRFVCSDDSGCRP
jgi:REP element-mobilizing transposase RayT